MKVEFKNYWNRKRRLRIFAIYPSISYIKNESESGLFIQLFKWCLIIFF